MNRGTCGKQMTMKQWEQSGMDKKMDAGKVRGHNSQETASDKSADKRDLAAYNSKACK